MDELIREAGFFQNAFGRDQVADAAAFGTANFDIDFLHDAAQHPARSAHGHPDMLGEFSLGYVGTLRDRVKQVHIPVRSDVHAR